MTTTSSSFSGIRPASTWYCAFSSSSLLSSGWKAFIRVMVAFIMVSWMPLAPPPIMLIMLIMPVDSSVVEGLTWMVCPSSVTR